MRNVVRGAVIILGVLLVFGLLLLLGNLLLGLVGIVAAAVFAVLPFLGIALAISVVIAMLWGIGRVFGCFVEGWKEGAGKSGRTVPEELRAEEDCHGKTSCEG